MDTTVGLLIVTVLIAVAFFFGLRWLFTVRSKYAGTQIVTCPETKRPASVEVDALEAAFTSAIGVPDIRLQNCSRWPIKKDCGQECLLDLDIASEDCLVHGVFMQWYRGKHCFFCKAEFGDLHLTDRKPALRSPEGKLLEWKQVSFNDIATVLRTYQPVCWDCYIAQSFLVEHPDLVVYRPWKGVGLTHKESVGTPRRPTL